MTYEEKVKEISYTVAIANEIIQKRRYELTKTQQKAVLYMISKIKPDDDGMTEYEFSIKRFCEVCNLNKRTGTYKQYLLDMLIGLSREPLVFKTERKSTLITHWFSSAEIDDENNDIVRITFANKLIPYLFALKEKNNYTMFFLENILPMKSDFGIRLYEYLKSVQYKERKHTMSLDELRERVGCEGKYKQYSEVRINILEPAMKDINLYTDIKVSYEAFKIGNKYTHIQFTITTPDSWEATDRHLNRKEALDL